MNGLLAELTQNLGGTEQTSPKNPFVIERIGSGGTVLETRPNWALIIPLTLVVLGAVIALSIYLYRRWQRTRCIPIHLAGKVCYAKPGETVKQAIEMPASYGCDWLALQEQRLRELGFTVEGWYTDSNLQIPLDLEQPIFAPVIIYPKVTKK